MLVDPEHRALLQPFSGVNYSEIPVLINTGIPEFFISMPKPPSTLQTAPPTEL